MLRNRERILHPVDAAQINAALLGLGARGNSNNLDATTAARGQNRVLLFDETDDFGTNGAESRDTHFEGCDH